MVFNTGMVADAAEASYAVDPSIRRGRGWSILDPDLGPALVGDRIMTASSMRHAQDKWDLPLYFARSSMTFPLVTH